MRGFVGVLGVTAMVAAWAAPGSAQLRVRMVELGLDQSFASPEEWSSPLGPVLLVEVGGLPLDLGVQVGVRALSQGGGDVQSVCGFAACEEGPFSQTYTLRDISLGIGRVVGRISSAEVVLAVNGSLYVQARVLRHRDTGVRSTRGEVLDPGVGPAVEVRLPEAFLGLRPVVRARYDRVFKGECLADASCYQGRSVVSFGLSLGWAR